MCGKDEWGLDYDISQLDEMEEQVREDQGMNDSRQDDYDYDDDEEY